MLSRLLKWPLPNADTAAEDAAVPILEEEEAYADDDEGYAPTCEEVEAILLPADEPPPPTIAPVPEILENAASMSR